MSKGNIIIIEGAQGVGKSTMASFLRDNLASSNLYRLNGIKDKTITGLGKNERMYLNLLKYMKTLEEVEQDLIFDRTFFTEEVYSLLGYKEYDFSEVYEKLVKELSKLNFNIYFVVLYLEDTDLYEKRLKRVHHNYQAFSKKNSVDQQNAYIKLLDEIKYKNIHTLKIPTDDFNKAYNILIENIPILKESGVKYEVNNE